MADEVEYTQPTEVIELERVRAEQEGKADPAVPGRDYRVEGNDTSAYLGVDAEYQTYASDTHKPYRATEGVAVQTEEAAYDADNRVDVNVDGSTDGQNTTTTATTSGTASSDDKASARKSAAKE